MTIHPDSTPREDPVHDVSAVDDHRANLQTFNPRQLSGGRGNVLRVADLWAAAHPADQFVEGNVMPVTELVDLLEINWIG